MSLVTDIVRFSFVNVFTPKAQDPKDTPKYSLTILIPKTDTDTPQRIREEITRVYYDNQTMLQGVSLEMCLALLHDGDGPKPNGGEYGPECKGHWVLNASSVRQPSVVDAQVQPILNPTEVYSGCYGRVSINFYAYSNRRKGVGCGLGNVQKLREGEPLGGGSTAEEDFGAAPAAMAGGSAVNTAVQPPVYGQPAAAAPTPTYAQPPAAAPVTQPAYGQAPPAPAYGQPAAPGQQIDPITGQPIVPGGVMGI